MVAALSRPRIGFETRALYQSTRNSAQHKEDSYETQGKTQAITILHAPLESM